MHESTNQIEYVYTRNGKELIRSRWPLTDNALLQFNLTLSEVNGARVANPWELNEGDTVWYDQERWVVKQVSFRSVLLESLDTNGTVSIQLDLPIKLKVVD